MNREEANALLPFITAFAQGKTIQMKSSTGRYHDMGESMGFQGPPEAYRIKPEEVKVERFAIVHAPSGRVIGSYAHEVSASHAAEDADDYTVVRLVGTYER